MLEINGEYINETPYIGIGTDKLCFSVSFVPDNFNFIEDSEDDEQQKAFGLVFFDGFETLDELENFRSKIGKEFNDIFNTGRRCDILVFTDIVSLENTINQLTYIKEQVVKLIEGINTNA